MLIQNAHPVESKSISGSSSELKSSPASLKLFGLKNATRHANLATLFHVEWYWLLDRSNCVLLYHGTWYMFIEYRRSSTELVQPDWWCPLSPEIGHGTSVNDLSCLFTHNIRYISGGRRNHFYFSWPTTGSLRKKKKWMWSTTRASVRWNTVGFY